MAYTLSKIPILYRTTFPKKINFDVRNILGKNMHEHLTNRTNYKAEQRFKILDNISNDYKLIYREQAIIYRTIILTYNGGWIGLISGILIIAFTIIKNPPFVQGERLEGFDMIRPLTKSDKMIILCVGLITSVLLIVSSKIVPFRIYHNPTQKLYKAVFVSNLLGKKNIITFSEGTAVPKFRKLTIMKDTLFDINGHTVLLDQECFPVPYVREQMIRRTK